MKISLVQISEEFDPPPSATPGYPRDIPGYPRGTPGHPQGTPGYPRGTPGVSTGYPGALPGGLPGGLPGVPHTLLILMMRSVYVQMCRMWITTMRRSMSQMDIVCHMDMCLLCCLFLFS